MRKLIVGVVGLIWLAGSPLFATIFATVKGIVHDPQHRPVPGAAVMLKARQADWTQTVVFPKM
jgi:hypothetical protein